MSIPLDDLLPTNDDAFEPVDSCDYFNTGSPFWEFADEFKWDRSTDTFAIGYAAANFEALLKSGRAFMFGVDKKNDPRPFLKRVEQYGRGVKMTKHSRGLMLVVDGHVER